MPPVIGCLPRLVALALAGVAFLAISLGLARVLSANNAEREAIERLLRAQVRGDAAAMIARIDDCAARLDCRAATRANAARLRSGGELEIVRLDPSTSFSLGGTAGTARVVWRTTTRTTVVQCVQVRRAGDELRALSRPIPRTTSCP
jgi:hypothetical protein